jgi:hypothetical protein
MKTKTKPKLVELVSQSDIDKLTIGDLVRIDYEDDVERNLLMVYEGIINEQYSFICKCPWTQNIDNWRIDRSSLTVRGGSIYLEKGHFNIEEYKPKSKNYKKAQRLLVRANQRDITEESIK